MPKSLFSASWYRVAELKPRLRSHAQIHRQRFRGQTWFVLQDHASGRFHRFSPAAHLVIGMMDGQRSVEEIWEEAGARLGDDLPTQDEMIQLLAQLHGADVLHTDVPPNLAELSKRSEKQRRTKLLQYFKNPLAVRLPLLDPDDFLTATLPAVRFLFGPIGLVLWLVVVVTAGVLAASHWPELTDNIADRVLAAESVVLIVLVYPIVKAIHELGHGYAVKVWGGEVHEMGIMMLVLMPVPYVDASASSAFREKWRRALVGAAGIMVELFLASVALLVWVNAEPGMVRATAFTVMLVAGVSTVLFNGNPLLKFDGYYVFADLIEIPNLGTRANRYIGYLIQRYLFGAKDVESPATAPGEPAWFVSYGIAAFIYRLFLMVAIILFVATKFFVIGVLLAFWSATMMYVIPLAKTISSTWDNPRLKRQRGRVVATCAAVVGAVLAGLLLVPIPHGTVAEGVVWVPERSIVRAASPGFAVELLARPNSVVRDGEPIIALVEPDLTARAKVAEAQFREFRLRYDALNLADMAEAAIVRDRMEHARAELALAQERVDGLLVRSPGEGALIVPDAPDLVGRFVTKGELLGYVVADSDPVVRVIVTQSEIDLVRGKTRKIELRFAERLSETIQASVQRAIPGASDSLPSMALSTEGGGDIPMDPTDPNHAKALATLFQLELRPATSIPVSTIGGRVLVRFDHGKEAIAFRLYRTLRLVFLRQFSV